MSEVKSKTSTGLEQNLEGLLCYLAGWITGIVFLVLEKENQFVRFHAVQSIVTFGAYTVVSVVVSLVFGLIPVFGLVVNWLLGVAALAVWILLMVKAYQGQRYKLPWAGDFAEKHLKSATGK